MRVLPLCLCVAIALGCVSRPPPPRSATTAAPAAAPPPPWPRFAEVAAWPAAGEPFPNRGHWGEGSVAVVRTSPEARAAYAALVADSALPDGAVVALFHHAAGGPDRVFLMEKEAGAWRYRVLTSAGVVVSESDSGCRGCHAGGVGDSLFGVPRLKSAASP